MKYLFLFLPFFFFLPVFFTYAQTATLIDATVTASSTPGYATLNVSQATLDALNLDGVLYATERYTTTNLYPLVVPGTQCYPRQGGSTAFPSSGGYSITLNASLHQTGNNSGGSPDCDISGVYYLVFRTGTNPNYSYYYIGYVYDVGTNTFSTYYGNNQFDLGINTIFNTRFTDLSITQPSSDIQMVAEYFLDTSEIDSNNPILNPTQVQFSISLNPSSTLSSRSENINNTINGTSTATTTFSSLADGTYDLQITFFNNQTIFTGNHPFPNAYIYTSFVIASGTLASVADIEIYTSQTYADQDIQLKEQPCSLSQLTGCLINAALYLFKPSDASLNTLTSLITDSPFPFVSIVYNSYAEVTDALDSATPVNTLGLDLVIAEANIDVEMFSVDTMTYLMGDTAKNIFRTVAQGALWLGFIAMAINRARQAFSINSVNRLS